jgi:hypothetical protein
MLGCRAIKMYAIFWIDSDGTKGNGEFILDEQTLRAWLGRMRFKYPEMTHWGQTADGERYVETIPIPLEAGAEPVSWGGRD